MVLALFALLLSIPLALLRGLILSQVWSWFIVPFGLPSIGIAWALGISIMISLLTFRPELATNPEHQGFIGAAISTVVMLTLWLFAFIIHLFM
jgi:hypothetical protein